MIVCLRTVDVPAAQRTRYLAWITEGRRIRETHGDFAAPRRWKCRLLVVDRLGREPMRERRDSQVLYLGRQVVDLAQAAGHAVSGAVRAVLTVGALETIDQTGQPILPPYPIRGMAEGHRQVARHEGVECTEIGRR